MLDRDGYLSLKGRAKELVKKGGEQVSPQEVRGARRARELSCRAARALTPGPRAASTPDRWRRC